jgi:regulator of protease activity HflC (stomatin/prohibitin superfamily)
MRIDHHAFQRATRVASVGLALQLAIALLLLIFGKTTGRAEGDGFLSDSASVIASAWAFSGLLVWLGLIMLFHQSKLERLEALEFDGGPKVDDQGRVFAVDEARVARKRLDLMHRVLMPTLSLIYALLLIGLALGVLDWLRAISASSDRGTFGTTTIPGWQLAVAFGSALVAFIFSRFVAGMAVQKAWANLRGGAAVMVGNALVCAAIGVGTVFRLLEDKPDASKPILEAIAIGIAVFMIVVAAETVLNFLLNLYRPRRAGEVPRPAFDSRVLSLLAAPDSIVRSINEAVNYQFGFDITSSWGYQLLLRNFARLFAIGTVVVLALTTLVVVQPQEQGLRLRFGSKVGDVYQGGPMTKLPWPVETALVLDVNRVRELQLGFVAPVKSSDFIVWGGDNEVASNANLFLVGAGARVNEGALGFDLEAKEAATEAQATDQFALVEADIVLQYRVRDGQLAKYLEFSGDSRNRGDAANMRDRALKAVALREITRAMSVRSLDGVLSPPASEPLVDALARAVQQAFDDLGCGVEVVGLSIPRLRPPGAEGGKFEELSIARQNGRRQIEAAQSTVNSTLSMIIGDVDRAGNLVKGIAQLQELESNFARTKDAAIRAEADALQARLEQMVLDSRAQAATVISSARARRWSTLMDAQTIAQEVLSQASAWDVDPGLFQTRKTMQVLGEALADVRVKYMLLPDPARVRVDIEMQEPTTGLNLGDYLEKKTDETTEE